MIFEHLSLEFVLFLMFALMAIFSSILVISAKNPIHSVFFLVLVFLNSAALFILLGVEFLALIFIIVYVGAIAILFLFVVMMLNIKLVELNENLFRYLPIGGLMGILFLFEIFLVIESYLTSLNKNTYSNNSLFSMEMWDSTLINISNLQHLGLVLYTDYFFLFLMASLILLVAMIGAIVLTLYIQTNVHRQDVYKQTSRHFSKSILLKN